MNGYFRYSEIDGVARLTLDLEGKPVNLLSSDVMAALDEKFRELESRTDLHLLIIDSNKKGIFIAGADIKEIQGITREEEAYEKAKGGQDVLNRLEMMPFPSLAYINGACMGGGTELALACTFRLTSDEGKTKIALPEVNLGIMPGFGGTQRLPRLVDIAQALPMILTGKPQDGKKAEKIGLSDRVIPHGYSGLFIHEFGKNIREIVEKQRSSFPSGGTTNPADGSNYLKTLNSRRKWQNEIRKQAYGLIRPVKRGKIQNPRYGWFLNKTALGRSIALNNAKKSVIAKTQGNYPAPLEAISTIRSTLGGNFAKGLILEAKNFGKLAASEISKNLIQIYFLTEENKKLPDPEHVPGAGAKPGSAELPETIRNTGVLGAGVMGGGIAWLFSKAEYDVALKDISWDAVQKGFDAAKKIYGQLKKRRKLSSREVNLGMHRISGTLDYQSFVRSDIVVEAVVEKMSIKQAVLSELEENVPENSIIASNTSSLSINEMVKALKKPERFAGMHFFNPVNRMPLVEVISGEQTDPRAAIEVARFALKLKKTPVFVKDGPGFLVNRILMPYLNEAAYLLSQGADVEQTDRQWKKWGMPMGPYTLIDEIGIDVARKVAKILEDAYPHRMKAAPILEGLKDHPQLLGKKNKQGFYLYKNGKKTLNPEMQSIIKKHQTGGRISSEDRIFRPLVMMVNEAVRCLDEGVVGTPGMLDLAMIMGTGFPPFRGGVLRTAQQIGLSSMSDKALQYSSQIDGRFTAPEGLSTRAKANGAFFKM